MNRRTFLKAAGIAAAGTPAWCEEVETADQNTSLEALFARRNDGRVERVLGTQLLGRQSPFYGGFPNVHGICFVGSAAWNASYLTAAYLLDESRYAGSSEIRTRLHLALNFLLRMQHADGTIDLISTNFHSPPDTAFAVEPVALALTTIRQRAADALPDVQQAAETFLRQAMEALIAGGIHTPNHRWVVCMALARLHRLFGDPRALERIDQWLAEGIDVDDDGQYAERSTATYTPLVNRCLMTVARLTDRPELYEPVRKNLQMTRYLLRPGGELVTETSRRQDRARRVLPGKYYYPYRAMAILDEDPVFSGVAQFIESVIGLEAASEVVLHGLEDLQALAPLPRPMPIPTNYVRAFPQSRIVRIRRGDRDGTIVAGDPTIFCLHQGSVVLESLRFASAFFGKGQFVGERIEQQGNGFLLVQHLDGRYLQPLDALETGRTDNWYEMPHDLRERTGRQQLTTTVAIHETTDGFDVHFHSEGAKRVPWAVEVGLRPGGQLAAATPLATVEGAALADQGIWSYQIGDNALEFSAGPAEHRWVELRGAAPKLDALSVYYTGYTPIDFTLKIRSRKV